MNRKTNKHTCRGFWYCRCHISNLHYSNWTCVLRIDRGVNFLLALKMLSSPYCAVSAPQCLYKHQSLTRWNANRCYLLQTTYLIFEVFQILFPTASLIFTAAKLFHQSIWERLKHKASTASHPHWRLFWNSEFISCEYLRNVHILWCLTWNKTKKRKQTLESA